MDNVRKIINTEIYNLEEDLNSIAILLTLNNKNFFKNNSIKFSISKRYSQLYKCSINFYSFRCNVFYDIKLKSKYAVIAKLKNGKLLVKKYSLDTKKQYDEFLITLINELDILNN